MVILTTIIYAMFFISCSNISNIKSTELNNIFIDNLNIGSSIKKINLNKYTESNAFLGDNNKEKWKDREQNLKKYIYFDKINNIKAEFVYVSFDESLVWIILSKINS